MSLRIKNWEKFQHYQHGRGAPPWVKIYRGLLNDKDWFALPGDAAKTLINLWLLAAEHNGYLPDIETLAFRLRLDSKVLAQHINACSGWLIDDASAMLAECYQLATPETETETEKRIPPTKVGLSEEEQTWLNRIRGGWPEKQHNGSSAPYSAPGSLIAPYRKTLKAGVTPEELAWCAHLYCQRMIGMKQYVVALKTFLGPQKIWEPELLEARARIEVSA